MNAMNVSPVKATISPTPSPHVTNATSPSKTSPISQPVTNHNSVPQNLTVDPKPPPAHLSNALPVIVTDKPSDLSASAPKPTPNGVPSPIAITEITSNDKEPSLEKKENTELTNSKEESVVTPPEQVENTSNVNQDPPKLNTEPETKINEDVKTEVNENKSNECEPSGSKSNENEKDSVKNKSPEKDSLKNKSPEKDSVKNKSPEKEIATEKPSKENEVSTEEEEEDEEEKDKEEKPVTPSGSRGSKRKRTKVTELIEEKDLNLTNERKSKRTRLPATPYQSPIPELQLIAKLTAKPPAKRNINEEKEKLIAFYKNEFLAVRNPEGSFYLCQSYQNIYRTSTKIKIRWLTQHDDDVYTPDFYDTTEFDCILTNVEPKRLERERWKLPENERKRVENILKRALDVEQGLAEDAPLTEEHPDGLDLSLFKDEAQLTKPRKRSKKKEKSKKPTEDGKASTSAASSSSSSAATAAPPMVAKKSPRLSYLTQSAVVEEPVEPKATRAATRVSTRKVSKEEKEKNEKNEKSTTQKKTKEKPAEAKATKSSTAASSTNATTTTTTKRRSSSAVTSTEKKPQPTTSGKRSKKEETKAAAAAATTTAAQTTVPERSSKVRNAGSAVTAKINSASMRTTKERERRSATTNQRSK